MLISNVGVVNNENTNTTNNFFKIMNKSMKPGAVAQRTLTEEQRKEQMTRAFLQKKASLAEGVLFNMVQGNVVADAKGIVKIANDIADEFMRVIYGQEITLKKASEE